MPIQKCINKDCKHEHQDKIHKGKRVMNPIAKVEIKGNVTKRILRCTVCLTEQVEMGNVSSTA